MVRLRSDASRAENQDRTQRRHGYAACAQAGTSHISDPIRFSHSLHNIASSNNCNCCATRGTWAPKQARRPLNQLITARRDCQRLPMTKGLFSRRILNTGPNHTEPRGRRSPRYTSNQPINQPPLKA